MISTTMNAVRETINAFLRERASSPPEDLIQLARVPTKEETGAAGNFVSMSLIRIDEELTSSGQAKQEQRKELLDNGKVRIYRPAQTMWSYVLFTGLYDDYIQSIDSISNIIAFFQTQNVFTPENAPSLPPEVPELSMDMVNQTGEQQTQMWGMLGSNARPAVLYQMRTFVIDEGTYIDLPKVKGIDIQMDKSEKKKGAE